MSKYKYLKINLFSYVSNISTNKLTQTGKRSRFNKWINRNKIDALNAIPDLSKQDRFYRN